MSFKHLIEIVRTSHFRTAAYFLVVFGLTGAALMAYLYWQTTFYFVREVDVDLRTTVSRWSRLDAQALEREITNRSVGDPEGRRPAVLTSPGGKELFGHFELVAPVFAYDKPFDAWQQRPNGQRAPVRAFATVMNSGLILMVGRDVHELQEFNERLRNAIVGGAFIVIALGLVGAAAVGRSARLRLDATASSLHRIVEGDLAARLPMRSALDDLDRIAAMVNAMLDEIQRLMAEVKNVTDDVAHDLKTPLTRMLAGLDRAQRGDLTRDELKVVVDDTAEDARLLLRMFKGLLRISEIENGARRDNFQDVDLNRIARDAVELFEPLAQERGVRIVFNASERPTTFHGDPDLLFDALVNLIDNAIKFTARDSVVTVQVRRLEKGLEVRVIDAGPGIPPEERAAVFRRFYRSEKSRHEPGHGLGLSLVSAVVRLHGMTLEIGDAHPGCEIVLIALLAESK